MNLHMRCGNLMLLLYTIKNILQICFGDEAASKTYIYLEDGKDEETNLKQAIFLVKLLRTEYAKVLRENEALREALHKAEAAQPTCPIIGTPTTNPISRYFRRQMPSEYHDHVPHRRLDYADTGQLPINIDSQTTPVSTVGSFDSTIILSTVTPGTATTIHTTTEEIRTYSSPEKVMTKRGKKRRTTRPLLKNRKMASKDSLIKKTKTKDPILAQVASELVHEISSHQMRRNKNKMETDQVQQPPESRKSTPTARIPTTLRIHLDRSSRYHIPLPVNHAFCYTNPENPLCRTVI